MYNTEMLSAEEKDLIKAAERLPPVEAGDYLFRGITK